MTHYFTDTSRRIPDEEAEQVLKQLEELNKKFLRFDRPPIGPHKCDENGLLPRVIYREEID